MAFTNEQLQKVKNLLERGNHNLLSSIEVRGMIERLDAAEKVLGCHVWGYCGKCKTDHEKDWLKSCGKGEDK